MSRENVELVQRVYEAVARRDPAAVLSFYDPDVEWDFTRGPGASVVGAHIYHGYEGLRSWFRNWHEAWERTQQDVKELIDAGDRVISVVTERGRGRRSGADVEMHGAAVWTIREGKVVRVVWLPTRDEALEAVGLRD